MKATTASANGVEAPEGQVAIQLSELKIELLEIEIVGLTPLIVHQWSEKAKREMLDKQTGKARTKKAPKSPEQDYEDSRYRIDDTNDGFPAVAFKAAIIGGARHFEGLTMTSLKQTIFVQGVGPQQLVPIIGKPTSREDCVRIGTGTADLRYRAMYTPWGALLRIRYVATAMTRDSVAALVNAAGLGGVGEWRPTAPKSYTGSYGTFRVVGGN